MRFPVRLFALRCIAACLPAAAGIVCAEPPQPRNASANAPEKICAPADLAGLRGRLKRRVVIEGRIVAMGRSRSGATSYLNFTKNYRDSVSLVFLRADGAGTFTKERLSAFIGRKVHVGGLLEERNGALQIRVFDLDQIRVLP